jgi:glutaredoxin
MEWLKFLKHDETVEGMPQVSMYTLSTCPSCDKAKKFFTERHVPFQYINYDLADQATQDKILDELEAEELQAFPFVHIGDQTVQGYDPKRYAQLLGIPDSSKSPSKPKRDRAAV